ncbi:DUF5689 domain-containing protein [Algoriphagus sp. D3-2-R+10]|uniref:DUF5689 domain-containing protein n=1 Tax=Algoriphagus aurantiacus TaxID=3103948 RepID=UPI002B39C7F3|nr:DUF5689 domain-containing protein [Algoriphagus sp. D3-2-R+10]MEB2778443.1 DUF5689 domain-containing protein [Algoriphagus sp. D3-2-R+10]
MKKFLLKTTWILWALISSSALAQEVFINEIHYDNSGTDIGEAIEIAGPAGTDLSTWSLVLYNGANGTVYDTENLTGSIPDSGNGYGVITISYPTNGIQNGAPDGIALIQNGTVVQFLSYEGSFQAVGGPADGMSSTDIGVSEAGTAPVGSSLQLSGSGKVYTDFVWQNSSNATFGTFNTDQSFQGTATLFINEFHYDNTGADLGEGIEVAGTAGLDLTGYSLVLYNGNNGASYNTIILNGTIPNQDNGFGTIFIEIIGLQNGSPDGFALVNPSQEVIQFLSYEGDFIAVGGPADGLTSEDVGVVETTSSPVGYSLQLQGSATNYADFTWSEFPIPSTYNSINTGQSFGGIIVDPEPELISIAAARQKPQGVKVIVKGILTASDQFGGPAFIQDQTGGIPVFDTQIHGNELFQIGDEIQLLATIGSFNQQLQLVDVEEYELISSGNPIIPISVSISELTSDLEGQLISIPAASFAIPTGLLFPESNYVITDGSGNLELRIDGEVTSLIGRTIPSGAQTITGVLGSFRGTLQLLPRFLEDLPGTSPYVQEGSEIPTSETLDIMTWNMEFFGATLTNYGPADVSLQAANALKVLEATLPDIIAVQEVSDESLLATLVSQLPGYSLICSDRYSYSFDGPDPSFPAQKLCLIYNTAVIDIIGERAMFEQVYDEARLGLNPLLDSYPTGSPSSFWSSGRLPWMVTAIAEVNGVKEKINLINIHAKSGSAAADLNRRRFDNQVLKDSLDTYFADANIILLGDYNDDLDESIGSGPSTYEVFTSDADFDGVTVSLSEAGLRSYIFQDNMIDHIMLSNELYDNYLEGSEGLFIPFNLIDNYANTTSDHLPVFVRMLAGETLLSDAGEGAVVYYGYPPLSSTVLSAADAMGGTAPYTYAWSDGQVGQQISVSPTETTTYILTVTDALGNEFTDEVTVCVVDVRSGNNGDKVMVCLPAGNSGQSNTLSVALNAVPSFLERGATLGSCGTVICGEETSTVSLGFKEAQIINAYPNPMEDQIAIELDQEISLDVSYILYSERGEVIESGISQFNQGHIEFIIQSNRFKKGIYFLHLKSEDDVKIVRLLKK